MSEYDATEVADFGAGFFQPDMGQSHMDAPQIIRHSPHEFHPEVAPHASVSPAEFEESLHTLITHTAEGHDPSHHDLQHHHAVLHDALGHNPQLKPEAHQKWVESLFGNQGGEIVKSFERFQHNKKKIVQHLEKLPQVESVVEDVAQHKYSAFAQASYDHFNGKNAYDAIYEVGEYIPEMMDFELDEELSTLDEAVFHNPETLETHVAYRGSQVKDDWTKTNMRTMVGKEANSALVQQGVRTMESVAQKYGVENITTSGHSMGFTRSLEAVHHMWEKFKVSVENHGFNGAMSRRQVVRAKQFAVEGLKNQVLHRTHFDGVSTHGVIAYAFDKKRGFEVNHVGTSPDHPIKVAQLDAHSNNHFRRRPVGFKDGKLVVQRHTTAKVVKDALEVGENTLESIANHPAGKALKQVMRGAEKVAKPLAVVGTGMDVLADFQDPTKTMGEQVADAGVDVAKGAGEWVGAGVGADLAMSASLMLFPEFVFGAGVLGVGAGIATAVGLGALADKTEDGAKAVAESVPQMFSHMRTPDQVAKEITGKKLNKAGKNAGEQIGDKWKKTGKGIKKFFTGGYF